MIKSHRGKQFIIKHFRGYKESFGKEGNRGYICFYQDPF